MSETDDRHRDEMVVECDLDAAPEKVWRALTVRELADQWLDLGNDMEAVNYEVLETVPHSRVRYAWHDGAADRPATVVTIDLSPLPEGRTRFRLTHAAIAPALPFAANGNESPTMARAA